MEEQKETGQTREEKILRLEDEQVGNREKKIDKAENREGREGELKPTTGKIAKTEERDGKGRPSEPEGKIAQFTGLEKVKGRPGDSKKEEGETEKEKGEMEKDKPSPKSISQLEEMEKEKEIEEKSRNGERERDEEGKRVKKSELKESASSQSKLKQSESEGLKQSESHKEEEKMEGKDSEIKKVEEQGLKSEGKILERKKEEKGETGQEEKGKKEDKKGEFTQLERKKLEKKGDNSIIAQKDKKESFSQSGQSDSQKGGKETPPQIEKQKGLFSRFIDKLEDEQFGERVLTGTAIGLFLLGVMWVNHPVLIWLVTLIIGWIGVAEVKKLFKLEEKIGSVVAVGVLIGALFFPPVSVLAVGGILIASWVAYYQLPLKNIGPLLYPITPLLLMLQFYADNQHSIATILWVVATVAVTDISAYFIGRILGGEFFEARFASASPSKTWEGVLGGLVIGAVIGTLIGLLATPTASVFKTFLIGLSAIFGDLFESYLKRLAGVKDSGEILPGHGGILDRIDGYLFAFVITFAFLL